MLRSRVFSLTRECPRCSDSDWGNGVRSQKIAYWLSSAWHISRCIAVDVSSPTYLSSVNVVRNHWHHLKPWRLTTGQGYSIVKSIQIHCTFDESASNEASYQIDKKFPWIPAKDHSTGILVLHRIGFMYSTQVNSVAYTPLTIQQVPLPVLGEIP